MIGIEEVFKFYYHADDALIKKVEDLIEAGKTTTAWQLIMEFLKTQLLQFEP